jgi:gamma-glutamylcyclotransferase (GGCT)/AIG2-like uncharacterized protein YtfP
MTGKTDLLFVYGSLRSDIASVDLPPESLPARALLAAVAHRIGPASVAGRLHAVAWYPGFIPGPPDAGRVAGELLRLEDPHRILPALDDYEGDPYIRKVLRVSPSGARDLDAWVYCYAASVDGAPRIDSGDYRVWLQTSR